MVLGWENVGEGWCRFVLGIGVAVLGRLDYRLSFF